MRTLLAPISALLILAATAFVLPARERRDDDARQRKIDYIFMEAQRQSALDSMAHAFRLLDRAWQLDTTDTQIGSQLALYYISSGSRELIEKGVDILSRHFEQTPQDYQSSTIFANVLTHMGNPQAALEVWRTLDSIFPARKDLKYQYANALMQTGDSASMVEAITKFEDLNRVLSGNSQIVSRIAASYLSIGDTVAALRSVRDLIAKAPLDASNYVLAGKVFNVIGLPDSVIYYYDRACAVDSTDGYAYYNRAEFYRERNDSAAFLRETTHALLNTDLDVQAKSEILINFAREFINDSIESARVDDLFRQVIDRYPHEKLFRTNYESFLYATKRYADAAEQAEYAVEIDPADPQFWVHLITLNELAADDNPASDYIDRAVDAGARAVAYFPDNEDIHTTYTYALYQKGNPQDVIRQAKIAADLIADPDKKASIICLAADVYQHTQQPDSAKAYYEHALELNPASDEVMNNYAYYLAVTEQDLDRAERLSAETIRSNPTSGTWLDTYAWVLFKRRDYQKAREYIDRALENTTDLTYEIFEHAGDIYFMAGDPERALEFWQQALPLAEAEAAKNKITSPAPAALDLLRRKVQSKTYFYK